MNFFIYSGLLSFLSNLIVGVFVYARNPENQTNRLFALFSFCVGGWSVGSFLVNIIPDPTVGLKMLRINYMFASILPAVYLHFIFLVTNSLTAANRPILFGAYFLSILFLPLTFTNLLVKDLRAIGETQFLISDPGPIYFAYFGYFAIAVIIIALHLLSQIKDDKFKSEPQFKFLIIANGLAILAGFEYFSRVFGLFSYPPFDDYILVAYVIVLSFAIKRHRLFDFETIAQAFQKEKLATIGLLAASVNHEIKNPLYAAKGMLETCIEKRKQGIDSKNLDESIDKTITQINRALEVIVRLNRFAKPTNETKEECSASVSDALQSVFDLVSYEFKLERIKIRNQISSILPTIKIHPRQLEEVLFNLIANACYVMKDGGELVVSGEEKNGKVTLVISDTGSGMLGEQLKYLFEPFRTTKGEKGTGLGLYITKQIIERNGGKISVQSEEGKGTSFILECKKA